MLTMPYRSCKKLALNLLKEGGSVSLFGMQKNLPLQRQTNCLKVLKSLHPKRCFCFYAPTSFNLLLP